MHRFYNKADIPWVSLVAENYYQTEVRHAAKLCGSLVDKYWLVAKPNVKSGDYVLVWSDAWEIGDISDLFYFPLSSRAFENLRLFLEG